MAKSESKKSGSRASSPDPNGIVTYTTSVTQQHLDLLRGESDKTGAPVAVIVRRALDAYYRLKPARTRRGRRAA